MQAHSAQLLSCGDITIVSGPGSFLFALGARSVVVFRGTSLLTVWLLRGKPLWVTAAAAQPPRFAVADAGGGIHVLGLDRDDRVQLQKRVLRQPREVTWPPARAAARLVKGGV